MEKRRWRTRLIVVAVLAVLVLVFGPKKLGWLVPGPDEAVTGYVMYELFSGSGAHDPAGEGLEELRTVLDDTWVLWWGVSNSIPMKDREDHPFWLEIYTEERIPAATFCLGSDGLRYEGKLRFRPLNADLLAALEKVHNGDPAQGGLVPVWYLLADDNGTPRCYLSGASIGRVMQGRSWAEIMGNYAPCADTDALCPGCALFGTVKGKGTSGRVRFTDAEAAQYESLGNKTLPILSGPKPSAYEFYLEKPKSTYETSIGFWNYDFCSLEETKCSPDGTKQTIKKFRVYTPQPRGRKFYWHSAPRTENERSNQNATLEAMKGTFKGSVYFDRITRAQLEELAFVLTLGENTPASPRLHKIGHGKPVGYGSCKITLTGGELRTLAQQDGTLCYTTEPLPLDSLLAAHGRIDTDSTSVKSLLKIADKRSTQSKTVEYPSAKDKNGNDKIFNWFSQNRKHAKSLVTLPHPLDNNITLEPKRGPDPAPRREGFAAPPRRESYTSTPQHEDAPLCVGRVYTGRVTGIKPYGAFVDLGSRRSGLVHIREIANHFVQSVDDELQIGQTVRVRVLDIKQEGGKEKISLSIKQA